MNRAERRRRAKRVPRKGFTGEQVRQVRSAVAKKLLEKDREAQRAKSAEELGLSVVRNRDRLWTPEKGKP